MNPDLEIGIYRWDAGTYVIDLRCDSLVGDRRMPSWGTVRLSDIRAWDNRFGVRCISVSA
jgi:hypothetical protein